MQTTEVLTIIMAWAITFTAVCTLILCLGFGPAGIGAGRRSPLIEYLQIASKKCGEESANWEFRNYCCCVSIIHVWSLHPSRGHFRDFDEHGDAGHNDAAGCYSRCGNRYSRGYTCMGLGHRQMSLWLRGFWVQAISASMLFVPPYSEV